MPRNAWGSIVKRRRKDGTEYGGYYLRYRRADGRPAWLKAGDTIKDAQATLEQKRDEVELERRGGIRRIGLAQFLEEEYRGDLALRLARTSYERAMAQLIALATWMAEEGLTMYALTERDATRYLAMRRVSRGEKKPPLAPATLRRDRDVAGACWDAAIKSHAARENPWRGVRLARPDKADPAYLHPKQIKELVAATPERYRAIVTFIACTGCRVSAALGLLWSDVTADFARVRFRKGKGGVSYEVALVPWAVEVLTYLRDGHARVPDGTELVFPGIDRFQVRSAVVGAAKRAGLGHVTTHHLRHALASLLVQRGVAVPDVARWLGHADARLALTLYGHHAPKDAVDRAGRRLAQVLRKPAVG